MLLSLNLAIFILVVYIMSSITLILPVGPILMDSGSHPVIVSHSFSENVVSAVENFVVENRLLIEDNDEGTTYLFPDNEFIGREIMREFIERKGHYLSSLFDLQWFNNDYFTINPEHPQILADLYRSDIVGLKQRFLTIDKLFLLGGESAMEDLREAIHGIRQRFESSYSTDIFLNKSFESWFDTVLLELKETHDFTTTFIWYGPESEEILLTQHEKALWNLLKYNHINAIHSIITGVCMDPSNVIQDNIYTGHYFLNGLNVYHEYYKQIFNTFYYRPDSIYDGWNIQYKYFQDNMGKIFDYLDTLSIHYSTITLTLPMDLEVIPYSTSSVGFEHYKDFFRSDYIIVLADIEDMFSDFWSLVEPKEGLDENIYSLEGIDEESLMEEENLIVEKKENLIAENKENLDLELEYLSDFFNMVEKDQ